jgi:hypothetical protein
MLGIDAQIGDVSENERLINMKALNSRRVNSGTGVSVSAHPGIKANKYNFYQLLIRFYKVF